MNPLRHKSIRKDETGVALFIVLSSVTLLSILATEFTYVAQVNSKMSADSVDNTRAHYMALTGFKISLLRLKIYRELKLFASGTQGKSAGLEAIPTTLFSQIWSFPFVYPIPTTLPGMTPILKNEIEKFTSDSSLQGSFSATIEAQSNKLNLNSVLSQYLPKPQATQPTAGGGTNPNNNSGNQNANPNQNQNGEETKLDLTKTRDGLKATLTEAMTQKLRNDSQFADAYNGFRLDELWDNILAWVDYSHQPRNQSGQQVIPYKRAPFYDISELHQIYPIDDTLYEFFSQNLGVFPISGININTMAGPILRTLFPRLTDQEVQVFFEFRDSTDANNQFSKVDDFYKYMADNTSYGSSEIETLKTEFQTRGIRLIIDEEIFKIYVKAQVQQASRIIEALVQVSLENFNAAPRPTQPNDGSSDPNSQQNGAVDDSQTLTDPASGTNPLLTQEVFVQNFSKTGLRILSMRVY